jgi:NADH-quinone oxidoreductase subunit C
LTEDKERQNSATAEHDVTTPEAETKQGVTTAAPEGTHAPEPSQILAEKASTAQTADAGEASSKPAAPKAKPAATGGAGGAAAAKKAPPPPDPRVEAAKAKAEQLKAAVVAKLLDAVEEVGAAHFTPMIRIRKEDWANAVELLRTHEEWKLNYVECMAGTDYPNYIEIVLYVQSTDLGHFVCLKTRTERDNAEVPSLAGIYPAVNWEEREIYDLLGVKFTNHPDLRRIMMWDEFKGHPLRKDYSEWDSQEEDRDGAAR